MYRLPYHLTGSRVAIALAGILVVLGDFAIVRLAMPAVLWYALRGGLAALAMTALLGCRRASREDFGLSLAGWRDDCWWIFKFGGVIFGIYVLLELAFVAAVRLGLVDLRLLVENPPAYNFRTAEQLRHYLVFAVVCAPLVEELVYRGWAVPALSALLGNRGAVLVSGPLFYALHLLYGLDWRWLHFCVAGWILSWAFLRRSRLWVPIVLHSLGNIMVGLNDALFLLAPGFVWWVLGR